MYRYIQYPREHILMDTHIQGVQENEHITFQTGTVMLSMLSNDLGVEHLGGSLS